MKLRLFILLQTLLGYIGLRPRWLGSKIGGMKRRGKRPKQDGAGSVIISTDSAEAPVKLTQNQRILAALRKGRTLTMLDIFKLCGSMSGHKRLDELEAKGLRVDRFWVRRGQRHLRAWRLP